MKFYLFIIIIVIIYKLPLLTLKVHFRWFFCRVMMRLTRFRWKMKPQWSWKIRQLLRWTCRKTTGKLQVPL